MTRWVAAATLDRAARAIAQRPGLGKADLARALGMAPSSMTHVLAELRETGEVLPLDLIRAAPGAPRFTVDETETRILRRARRGLVVLSELAEELQEPPEEVRRAVRELRAVRAILTPRGIWPPGSHHNPERRPRRLHDEGGAP